jgi:hypothetical protein
MARRSPKSEAAKYEKWISEGGSARRGADYVPFIQIQDFQTRGNAVRVKGWKTNRVQHFLSELEYHVFLKFEWSPDVLDIREQFALHLPETLTIAEKWGYRHSTIPTTREAKVVTSDFVVTHARGLENVERAYAVKPSSALNSKRELEKLEIEWRYWQSRGIEWEIVTEREVPRTFVENIKWVHNHRELAVGILPESLSLAKAEQMLLTFVSETRPLADAAAAAEDRLGLQAGAGLAIVRHLIATKRWRVDMTAPLNPCNPIRLLHSTEERHGNLREHVA